MMDLSLTTLALAIGYSVAGYLICSGALFFLGCRLLKNDRTRRQEAADEIGLDEQVAFGITRAYSLGEIAIGIAIIAVLLPFTGGR